MKFPIIRTSSVVVMAICTQAICGHMMGKAQYYDWNHSGAGMSLNTAVCLFIISICMFHIAVAKEDKHK